MKFEQCNDRNVDENSIGDVYDNLKYYINKRIKVTVDKNTDRNNKFPQKESIKLLSRQLSAVTVTRVPSR